MPLLPTTAAARGIKLPRGPVRRQQDNTNLTGNTGHQPLNDIDIDPGENDSRDTGPQLCLDESLAHQELQELLGLSHEGIYYGNIPGSVPTGCFRFASLNPGGLSVEAGGPKDAAFFEGFRKLGIDVMALQYKNSATTGRSKHAPISGAPV